MTEFSADWLSLREPVDAAARSAVVAGEVTSRLAGRDSVRVLDLATGTGANLRCLAPQIASPQRWLVVDRDVELLSHVPRRVSSWALSRAYVVAGDQAGFVLRGAAFECRVECRQVDLGKLTDATLFRGHDLVTASALLDLVSEQWLQALVTHCAAARAPVLFALTYDGRMTCTPEDPDDGLVRNLINRHQRRAKGFGRALGPDAIDAAIRWLREAGYGWRRENSDWQLTPAHSVLQRQLVEGWAEAAREMDRKAADLVSAWKQRRMALIDAGQSEAVVGHADLAAWPAS
jgi:hypothetical protein